MKIAACHMRSKAQFRAIIQLVYAALTCQAREQRNQSLMMSLSSLPYIHLVVIHIFAYIHSDEILLKLPCLK